MINPDDVNDYLAWARDKTLYPPQYTPEDYIDEILKSEARLRLNMLTDYFDRDEELELDVIKNFIYAPIGELGFE